MNIEECKEQIKRHEGEVLEIYEDNLGYKTLGVGHLCRSQDPEYTWELGRPVSQEIVDLYFDDDFEKHYQEAMHILGEQEDWDAMPESVQHVLVNMCFNLGSSRLRKFKNMLKACREHDWKEMASQMEDSRWFNQVGRRSVELQEMVLDQEG